MNVKRYEKYDMVYLESKKLSEIGFTKHIYTTRSGGVSSGMLGSMNLNYNRGDNTGNVDENFRRVGECMGFTAGQLLYANQTHTTNVFAVTKEIWETKKNTEIVPEDVDGLVTDIPGVVLMVSVADCVPILIADRKKHCIGAVHSGWKGTAGRIGQKTVELMKDLYGTKPEDLIVSIGPSICVKCYEVSEDVATEFRHSFRAIDCRRILKRGKEKGKYQLNLQLANSLLFQEAGVPLEQIEQPGICTCCNPEFLFSHRASGGVRGNMAALIEIKEPPRD